MIMMNYHVDYIFLVFGLADKHAIAFRLFSSCLIRAPNESF